MTTDMSANHTSVLRPEQWPYRPDYVRACERAMERIGVPVENRYRMMGRMTRAHGDPLTHLHLIEEVICRGRVMPDYGPVAESAVDAMGRL